MPAQQMFAKSRGEPSATLQVVFDLYVCWREKMTGKGEFPSVVARSDES